MAYKKDPERPGVMLYFDMFEPLKALSYEDKGRLLDAMLSYGKFGLVPEFDGLLMIAWGYIRPRIDSDGKNYREKIVKTNYASYCAKNKRASLDTLPFEEWLQQERIDAEGNAIQPDTTWNHMVPSGTGWYPTTTSTTKTNTNSISTTTPTTESTTATTSTSDSTGKGKGTGEGKTEPKDFNAMRNEKIAMLSDYKEL